MKKNKKKIVFILLAMMLEILNTLVVSAAELPKQAVYDLEEGGTQTFLVKNEKDEEIQIVVEEIIDNSRISDNKYRIVLTSPGAWTAGFYVIIVNNQIEGVYSPFYSTFSGSIINGYFMKNSNMKATYSFVYKATLFLEYETGVQVTMSGTELKVSKI